MGSEGYHFKHFFGFFILLLNSELQLTDLTNFLRRKEFDSIFFFKQGFDFFDA